MRINLMKFVVRSHKTNQTHTESQIELLSTASSKSDSFTTTKLSPESDSIRHSRFQNFREVFIQVRSVHLSLIVRNKISGSTAACTSSLCSAAVSSTSEGVIIRCAVFAADCGPRAVSGLIGSGSEQTTASGEVFRSGRSINSILARLQYLQGRTLRRRIFYLDSSLSIHLVSVLSSPAVSSFGSLLPRLCSFPYSDYLSALLSYLQVLILFTRLPHLLQISIFVLPIPVGLD
jgi:hypothetical protein